jgi:hypothetical protein
MQAMEAFGVPRRIVAFVMPDRLLVQPRRQHATARSRRCSRRRPGDRHALGTQLLMMLTLMLTSKGVACRARRS